MKPRLQITLFRHDYPIFLFLGLIGYFAGCILGLTVTYFKGLNGWVTFLLCGVSAGMFFVLVWGEKLIKGKEEIVYYHHEIGILTACVLTLWLTGFPVLSYLDITLMGIGALLTFGRWGCYHVGCCHGRPSFHRWGVVYGYAHAEAGFTPYYVGVKLIPIPLVESFWVLATITGGVLIILSDLPPGTTLVWYTVVYGLARFVFEFFRGDPERPYWMGFSEAQWTTVVLFTLTVVLAGRGMLPYYPWHAWAGAGLLASMPVFSILQWQNCFPMQPLFHVHHIAELMEKLDQLEQRRLLSLPNTPIAVEHTSAGLHLSAGQMEVPEGRIHHYTVSADAAPASRLSLDLPMASKVARLISLLRHQDSPVDIKAGKAGIYHLLIAAENQNAKAASLPLQQATPAIQGSKNGEMTNLENGK